MATEKETIILEFEVDTSDAVVSIDSLTKANKALREERKNLDLQTDSGVKRAQEINTQIDKNTNVIKANSSTLEKNRLNVGNYTESINKSKVGLQDFNKNLGAATPALDNMSGGLVSAGQGFMGMVKGVLAFIATPIGAVIGAIGLAISALTAYFKGSEEGQDKLAKVMAIGKVVFDGFLVAVEAVGEGIFKVIEIVGSGVDKIINIFSPAVGAAFDATIKKGADIADLQDKIEADENEFIVKRAQTDKEVAKLREQALKQEGDAKKKTIQQAIDLEKSLAKEEQAHAKDKLNLIKLEIASSGAATEEQKKQLADATAAVINSEAQEFESTLRFQKQVEALHDEEIKKQEQRAEAYKKLQDQKYEAYKKDIEQNEKLHESNDELYENTLKKLDKIDKKEKEVSDNKKINYASDLVAALNLYDAQVAANKAAADKVIAQQQEDNAKLIAGIVEQGNQTIALADQLATGIFAVKAKQYDLEENQLNVALANQKTILNKQYAQDLAALDAKYTSGELSKKEYDAAVLALNQKNQADIKAAEIKQAKDLNDVKRKEFEANKKNRIASAIADAAKAVLSTFANAFGGLVAKGIAAAAAGVFAAIQVSQIKKEEFVPTTFRTGGYTGDGDPNQIAGQVHKSEFVMPADVVSQYGKEHFQSYMDGSIVANGSGGGGSSQSQGTQSPVYLNYTEFKKFVREIELKESIVSK